MKDLKKAKEATKCHISCYVMYSDGERCHTDSFAFSQPNATIAPQVCHIDTPYISEQRTFVKGLLATDILSLTTCLTVSSP